MPTGYRLQDLDRIVVRSLHNPYLASGSVNTGFKTSLNGIEHPVLVNSEKVKVSKKYFFFKTKKVGGIRILSVRYNYLRRLHVYMVMQQSYTCKKLSVIIFHVHCSNLHAMVNMIVITFLKIIMVSMDIRTTKLLELLCLLCFLIGIIENSVPQFVMEKYPC